MKKSRLSALFTALALTVGLFTLPAAAQGSPEPTPAASPAPQEEVQTAGAHFTAFACDPAQADGGSALLAGLHIQAGAAILVDVDHGQILYAQNPHQHMYPASITKVMTTLLALEAVDKGQLSLDQVLTASSNLHAGIGEGASNADIKEGEQMRVIDLLYCAMLPSANEACNVLAEAVSGSVTAFVELMNRRAAELGMEDTHFANSHGYHDNDHYTSAYDIALMSREAMQHELFRTMAAAASYTLPATNQHDQRVVRSTNALISNWNITGYLYQYATGVKTGSTNEARYCLASSAQKNGRQLIAVVLGAENPTAADGQRQRLQFSESARLLDWGFDNTTYQALLDDTRLDIAEVEVTLSSDANYVAVRPEGSLAAVLPNDLDPASFTYTPVLDAESITAPVEEGQVLGSINVSHGGVDYGTLPLVANAGVERSELLYRMEQVKSFLDQTWVKVAGAVLAVLVVGLLLRALLFRGRGRGGRGGGYSYGGGVRTRYSGRRRR